MNYNLVGRHMEITEGIREHLDTKMQKLNKHFSGTIDARVVLSIAPSPHIAKPAKTEIQVNLPGGTVRVEEAHTDLYVAIDHAIERIDYQIKRYKERHFDRHHEQQDVAPAEIAAEPSSEGDIVRVKQFHLRPMAPEDAAFEMERIGHDFYMFRNGSTDEINVIYRRKNGDYGLIEPH